MTAINTLPRTLIKTYLQGLRLPLTTLEWVTNKSDAKDWPPAIAFEAFEGGAKRFLGSLIGDDELVHEGMLQRTKVAELARAERLEAMAAQRRAEADAKLRARQESTDQARARADDQAEQREHQIERDKDRKEQAVSDRLRRREEAAARSARQRDELVADRQREAARTRIAEETAAVTMRSQALGSARKAQAAATALQEKRAQRKGG